MQAHTYTAQEKKEFVKLLKKAKTRLWNGKHASVGGEIYICHAIHPGQSLRPIVHKLRAYIEYMLDGASSVEGYLLTQGIGMNLINEEDRNIKVQQYRLDWINHMIAEFSK